MVQWRHAVEDVGDERAAAPRPELEHPVQRGPGGDGVGVGMPDRRDDARCGQLGHQRLRAGAFGGEGHLDHAAASGLGQGLDEGRIGVDEGAGVLSAAPHHGEERTLEVDPRERAVGHEPGARGHAVEEGRAGRRDQRSDHRGGAVAEVVSRRRPPGVGVRAELAAGAAVTVQVHQPGQQRAAVGPSVRDRSGAPGQLAARPDPGDPVTIDEDRPVVDDAGRGDHATGQQRRGVHARHHGGRRAQSGLRVGRWTTSRTPPSLPRTRSRASAPT